MINKYEAMVVYNSDLSDDQLKAEISKIETTVRAHQGNVTNVDTWGKRPLAYKINNKDFGIYVLILLEGDNTMITDLQRQLKINEQALRHIFVTKDKFAPDFTARARENMMPSQQIYEDDFVADLVADAEIEPAAL